MMQLLLETNNFLNPYGYIIVGILFLLGIWFQFSNDESKKSQLEVDLEKDRLDQKLRDEYLELLIEDEILNDDEKTVLAIEHVETDTLIAFLRKANTLKNTTRFKEEQYMLAEFELLYRRPYTKETGNLSLLSMIDVYFDFTE